MIPDDWKQLPSGVWVKVWTAEDLDPESRRIIVGAAHAIARDLDEILAVEELRHLDCEPGRCKARRHSPSLN